LIKKIFKAFYYLVIVAITIIVLFLILSVFPTKSGYGSFVVLSGSVEHSTGERSYVTKGDANNTSDQELVKESEVLGKVVISIPYIGYVIATAQKPIGFIMIIIVPAVIIIYDELHKIKKEVLKKVDYKKRSKKRKELKEKNNNRDDDKISKKDNNRISENKEKNDKEKEEV